MQPRHKEVEMDKPIQNQPLSSDKEVLDLEELMKADDKPDEESNDEIVDETELANRITKESKAKKEKDDKDETDEDEEKEDEKEEELELEDEPEDEDLELIAPVARKEILKAFPDLFKKFPYLERAYYREQKYTEIFPTIKDAEEAQQTIGNFGKYVNEVSEGNLDSIISEVKKNDENSFAKLVNNYLPSLYKADQRAYFHVVSNLVRDTVQRMFTEGKRTENEALQGAAAILNQFVFGTSDYVPPSALPVKEKKDDGINQERAKFIEEKLSYHLNDLETKVGNTLTATIDNHIDPKGVMSVYVRKNAVKDCLDSLNEALANDTRFVKIKDMLWEQAFKSNFNRNSLEKIRSAFLSRAKTLLPELIKRTRNEAMRGQSPVKRNREEVDEEPIERGKSSGPSIRREEKSKPTKGMSTLEFFNQD